MIIKKESKKKIENTIMIIKQKDNYTIGIIGLYMGINISNKEAKIQFTKKINVYIMKNIMKNTNKKRDQYVGIIDHGPHPGGGKRGLLQ
jgi:hypothetical protein